MRDVASHDSSAGRGTWPLLRCNLQRLVRVGLAALFLYAAVMKLADPAGFAADISHYRILPDAVAPLLAVGLPVLELVAAAALLLPGYVQGGAALSALMLLGFAAGMAQAKVRGIDLECGCFGTESGAKVSYGKVALNAGLAILSLWIMRSSPARTSAKAAAASPARRRIGPDGRTLGLGLKRTTLLRIGSAASVMAAVACIGLFAGAGPVSASVVRSLSLEDLTRKADEILVGIPTEQQSRRHIDGRLIVTDFSFQAETVLKGETKPGETTLVTVLGGKLDGVGLQVPGEAGFAIGKRVVAFLYRAPRSGDLRVVGMSQGVLPITLQPDGNSMVLPSSGAALLDPGTGNTITESSAALAEPAPLPVLLQRISKIVAGVK